MEHADVVRRRRMVRRYRPDPVPVETVEAVLDLARRGPSAGWSQGVRFVVVTDAADRLAVAGCCREPDFVARGFQPWLSTAPVLVVACVVPQDYRERYAEPDKAASRGPDGWHVPYWWVDGGAALMGLLLAATDAGLGAGFLDIRDPACLRRLLTIPDEVELLGLVTLGHPADDDLPPASRRRNRRPLDEVVRWGRW